MRKCKNNIFLPPSLLYTIAGGHLGQEGEGEKKELGRRARQRLTCINMDNTFLEINPSLIGLTLSSLHGKYKDSQ